MTDIFLGVSSNLQVIIVLLGVLVIITFACAQELWEIECNLDKIIGKLGDNKWNKS